MSHTGVWLKAGILRSQVADNLGRGPDWREAGARWRQTPRWNVHAGRKWVLGTSNGCKGRNPTAEREIVKDKSNAYTVLPRELGNWTSTCLDMISRYELIAELSEAQTCDGLEGMWAGGWGNKWFPWNDHSMWIHIPPLLLSSLFLVQFTRISRSPGNLSFSP